MNRFTRRRRRRVCLIFNFNHAVWCENMHRQRRPPSMEVHILRQEIPCRLHWSATASRAYHHRFHGSYVRRLSRHSEEGS